MQPAPPFYVPILHLNEPGKTANRPRLAILRRLRSSNSLFESNNSHYDESLFFYALHFMRHYIEGLKSNFKLFILQSYLRSVYLNISELTNCAICRRTYI